MDALMTQTLLERAKVVATDAHSGHIDKGGGPYILHPLRLMASMSTEAESMAAPFTMLRRTAMIGIWADH